MVDEVVGAVAEAVVEVVGHVVVSAGELAAEAVADLVIGGSGDTKSKENPVEEIIKQNKALEAMDGGKMNPPQVPPDRAVDIASDARE